MSGDYNTHIILVVRCMYSDDEKCTDCQNEKERNYLKDLKREGDMI